MRSDKVYVNGMAMKNDASDNKPPLEHLCLEHVAEMCRVFAWAEGKYPRNADGTPNYYKGHYKLKLLAAAMRHILAAVGGEEFDPESGLSHVAHAQASLAMIQKQKQLGTLVEGL